MLVQKLRLQRGWSQQQLADLSGLSVRTVQRIERGQGASVESLKSLASVFEIDFTQLQENVAVQNTDEWMAAAPNTAAREELLAMRHVETLRRFYTSLALYAVIITLLVGINVVTFHGRWWAVWPALGWGIALLVRAARVFEWLPIFGSEWERREIEKRLGRPLS